MTAPQRPRRQGTDRRMPIHLDLEEEPINTTPMIDVVLNLLIFFMLSAVFVQEERALEVQLPSVSAAAPLTEAPDELVVNVLLDGKFVLRDREVSAERLGTELAEARRNYPDQRVAVRGHRRAAYEHVASALAIARKAGIAKLSARVLEGP